jgi:hypothetical protein
MGQQFAITIIGLGEHGCDRRTRAGDRLRSRCGRLDCVDCLALDFVQNLRQKGYILGEATLVHGYRTHVEITDDLLKNERRSGDFFTQQQLTQKGRENGHQERAGRDLPRG